MTKAEQMREITDIANKKISEQNYLEHLLLIEERAKEGYSGYTYEDSAGFLSAALADIFKAEGFTYNCVSSDNKVTITICW